MASPLLGCGEVVNVWANLDFSALDESAASYAGTVDLLLALFTEKDDPIRKLACNFPSIYELMPSEQYFTLAEKNYMIEGNSITGQIQLHTTYSSTTSLVSDALAHFNQALMTSAEAFHASLYLTNGLHISSLTDSYYLYGTGIETRTMYNCLTSRNEDPMAYGKDYIYRISYDLPADDANVFMKLDAMLGDGLVVQWSAALGGASAYTDKIYCCPKKSHMDIIDGDENGNIAVCDFMRGIVLENYTYQENDNFKNEYGFIDLSWVTDSDSD